MFVLKSQVTCQPAPLPVDYGVDLVDYTNAMTDAMARAQGAFNLGTYRPDLAPNGVPWADIPDWAMRNLPGADIVGEPCSPPPDLGTWGNGRVVGIPHCTPMSTAQRYSPPPTAQQCAATGYSATTLGPAFINGVSPYWYHPVGEIVQYAQKTNTPIPAPPPGYTGMGPLEWLATGGQGYGDDAKDKDKAASENLCREMAEGNIDPAGVPAGTVQACMDAGYSIPGLSGVGVAGMGACSACDTGGESCGSCSGNTPITPMWEESPAERARRGGDVPSWLLWAGLAAVVVYGVKGAQRA